MDLPERNDPRIQKIVDRIPPEWGKYLPPQGWWPLIIELDEKLNAIIPDYVVQQAKEKFGGLRYYIDGVDLDVWDDVHNLISEYEAKSWTVCQACGNSPASQTEDGWIATLCTDCAKTDKRGYDWEEEVE